MSGSDIVTYLILIGIVAGTVGWWKIFEKADEAGWKAIIPIYSAIVGLRIAGRPWWWVLLLFIPFVQVVVLVIWFNELSKSFGKSAGFTLGLVLLHPIFALILGFDDAQYRSLGGVGTQPLPTPTS
ncbi:MAG: DUF5684 domain-containing protein [Acidimicrobiia bacterium]|nr:DUF5684 domain-containing protein [Acidimicrobiia bacterium]